MARILFVSTLCAALAVAGLGWMLWPDQPTGQLPYRDAAIVRQGATLYAGYCASCHGVDLQGQANWRDRDGDGYLPAPPHDETGHTWHHADAILIEITSKGTAAVAGGDYQSRMTGFADTLSDAEILAVLAFVKSTWPPPVIDRHNRINAATADG